MCETGYLTQQSLDHQYNILADEAEDVMAILRAENLRGELTQTGARELTAKLNHYAYQHPSRFGLGTTVSYHTSNNRIKGTRVRSERHEEVDADRLAMAVWSMAEQEVGYYRGLTEPSTVVDAREIK